jgi:hypothetical protein
MIHTWLFSGFIMSKIFLWNGSLESTDQISAYLINANYIKALKLWSWDLQTMFLCYFIKIFSHSNENVYSDLIVIYQQNAEHTLYWCQMSAVEQTLYWHLLCFFFARSSNNFGVYSARFKTNLFQYTIKFSNGYARVCFRSHLWINSSQPPPLLCRYNLFHENCPQTKKPNFH